MSVFDDMYRDVNARQEQARTWEQIRAQAIHTGDSRVAQDALWHLGQIHGLPPQYWTSVRRNAIDTGDSRLADLARDKMNEAGNNPGPIPPFPGGGFPGGGFPGGGFRPF